MHRFNKSISLFVFTFTLSASFSQDIISVDGHNMGSRKDFLEVCAGDVDVNLYQQQGYSNVDFCNCLADNLLTQLTKKEINYYFTQNNHAEIAKDTVLSQIAFTCMIDAQNNWKQPPPPQQTIVTNLKSQSLIDSIVELVDYEVKFNEILEGRLMVIKDERNLNKQQLESLKENIRFDELRMVVIKNAYMDYSTEELSTIYDYLSEMSPEELSNSTVKYEQIMIDYFTSMIGLQIKEELD